MLAAVVAGMTCAGLGITAGVRLRKRCAYLRAWQRALLNMHAACAYARSSSAQVLRAGAAEIRALASVARAVEINGADAAEWFCTQEKSELLRQEEYQTLLLVMHALSDGGRQEQAEALQYALERIRQCCEQSERKRDTDARMYVTLGMLSGLCAFLMLC